MTKKVRHVLGISGGKDSAALALYLNERYPELDIEYYFCDTGKELKETYELINKLEAKLGKEIIKLEAASKSHEDPFDHFLKYYGGFLPSSSARWCTKKLKLEPFEQFVGDDPVISYVGIRGDEDREGYISKKPNIQSIFPYRQNIWSQDVVKKVLANDKQNELAALYPQYLTGNKLDRALNIIDQPLSKRMTFKQKLKLLVDIDEVAFNKATFQVLKSMDYPLSTEPDFPLLENNDILVRDDIFEILRTSGVGVPQYYEKRTFEVNGKKGEYARSRSGCFFCFFQQKIEWVWLFENHRDLFLRAETYEKDGYTWMQDETLRDLIGVPRFDKNGKFIDLISVNEDEEVEWVNEEVLAQRDETRSNQIKEDQLKKLERIKDKKSPYLLDILEDAEGEGCAACFV